MNFLNNHVEALVFCSNTPIKLKELQGCLNEMFGADVPEKDIRDAIEEVRKKYDDEAFSIQLVHSGGGYQFLTKPAYQASISILLKHQSKKRLSTAAMETLAIIAYKQPVSKPEVEQIRGVNCDYTIQKLLDKGLIEIRGKADSVGKPIIYGTSEFFMDYFGINDLQDLPTPKDFQEDQNTIGEEKESS